MTSVVAVDSLVASRAEKAKLDPVGEFTSAYQLSRAWQIQTQ